MFGGTCFIIPASEVRLLFRGSTWYFSDVGAVYKVIERSRSLSKYKLPMIMLCDNFSCIRSSEGVFTICVLRRLGNVCPAVVLKTVPRPFLFLSSLCFNRQMVFKICV